MSNFESFVVDGYERNAVIFAAIAYKMRAISAAPLRAYRGTRDNPIPVSEGSRLAKLIAHPNEHQTWVEFQQLNTVYKNLSGNVYVWMVRSAPGVLPERMLSLRPDCVRIIPKPNARPTDKDYIRGYAYIEKDLLGVQTADAIPILVEDMIHIKYPNPLDPMGGKGYGSSPIFPMAQSGDVDNAITSFIKIFMQKGGMPPIAITYKDAIEEADAARAKARWQALYGGFQNWLEPAILDGDAKIHRVGFTFQEMAFNDQDARNEARMLMVLGVPAILVGARMGLERATYNNVVELRRVFWEDTMIPELHMDEVEYQRHLFDGNAFVMFDTSRVPALRRDVVALTGAAWQMFQMGVAPGAAFAEVGINVEVSAEIRDTPFISRSVTEYGVEQHYWHRTIKQLQYQFPSFVLVCPAIHPFA